MKRQILSEQFLFCFSLAFCREPIKLTVIVPCILKATESFVELLKVSTTLQQTLQHKNNFKKASRPLYARK